MNLIYEHAPTVSLLFFFAVFIWVTFQAYRPGAKKRLEEYGSIPLREYEND